MYLEDTEAWEYEGVIKIAASWEALYKGVSRESRALKIYILKPIHSALSVF